MAGTETHIAGLSDLHKMLQTLPAKIEGNVMRGALRAGQSVVLQAVRSEVPVQDGHLLRSLKVRQARKSAKYGWLRMRLTAGDHKAWYAGLLEFGTASYYTGNGKSVRKPYKIKPKAGGALLFGGKLRETVTHPGIRPMPFMRTGFDKSQAAALRAIEDYIRRRLPKEIGKAGLSRPSA